jgi:hypothetical protein
MAFTRIQVRLWRKQSPYGVEKLRWLPWPKWKLITEYSDEQAAMLHARHLASDGFTTRYYRGDTTWVPKR